VQNELTGEHTCIMLKVLNSDDADTDSPDDSSSWLTGYWTGLLSTFLITAVVVFRAVEHLVY